MEGLEVELARLQSIVAAQPQPSRFWPFGSVDTTLFDRMAFLERELALSVGKCKKWEARKAAALKVKAALDKAQKA